MTSFHRTIEKEVMSFLNKLNDNGIAPEEIKISEPTTLYVNIYYYSDKEI